MLDAPKQAISLHERALQLALKETLAQQKYAGIVPLAPDYETVARRAQAIKHALAAEEQAART